MILTYSDLCDIYYEDSEMFELVEITSKYDSEHRWFWTEEMIFTDGKKFYSTWIMVPKSETQDGQDRFDSEQEYYEVERKTVTITEDIWAVIENESKN